MSRTRKIEKANVPKILISEVGYNGLSISAGQINEEMKRELQFPTSIITYKQMSYDSMISAALNYYEQMMLKSRFTFKSHALATEEQKQYAEFMEECINDMEHSWQDFIQEVSSMNTYGFCVNEIVLRKRLKSKGSKYNDGKIGIHKLPIRSQDSIAKWVYDEEQNLIGVTQSVAKTGKRGQVLLSQKGEDVTIPRQKFLLFRLGKKKDSPLGESPLRGCYYSWKYKTAVEDLENTGMSRDLSGIPIAKVPPQIMSPDASPELQQQYEQIKNIVRNIHNNNQAGIVWPLAYDENSKQPMYEFSLLKNDGGKSYDTKSIKEYYCNAILTALSADVLLLGQSSTGSYALGNMKGTMTAIAIEYKLKEICNVINQHLIPLIAKYNDWDLTRLPYIVAEDLEAASLEEVSKFIQRTGAVGFLPRTPAVVNKVLDTLGLEPIQEDTDLDDILTSSVSRSGDGMSEGLNDGVGTSTKEDDNSSVNLDNNA